MSDRGPSDIETYDNLRWSDPRIVLQVLKGVPSIMAMATSLPPAYADNQ